VSNSQLIVFYSEHRHKKIYGYMTNWNSTGYFDIHSSEGKYSAQVL